MEEQQELTLEESKTIVKKVKRKGINVTMVLTKKQKEKEKWDRTMRMAQRFRERK